MTNLMRHVKIWKGAPYSGDTCREVRGAECAANVVRTSDGEWVALAEPNAPTGIVLDAPTYEALREAYYVCGERVAVDWTAEEA